MAARFWVLGSGLWTNADTTHWSASSGGAGGASVPTASDNVYFDSASNLSGYTIGGSGAGLVCNNLSIANPDTGQLVWNGGTITVSGNIDFRSTFEVLTRSSITFNSTSANTITTKAIPFFSTITFNGVGGSWTLADALAGSGAITVTNGSFDTNDQDLTIFSLSSSNSNVRSISLGSSFVTITGNGTCLNFSSTLTFNAGTSTLKFTSTTGSFTFNGGGQTFYNVWISRGASAAALTITGSNTYNDFKDNGTAAHNLQFQNTQTFRNFHVSGTPGNLITLTGAAGTFNQIKIGGGFVSVDYLDIRRTIATPTNTWYAGTHSTNNQLNFSPNGSGWFFSLPYGYVNIAKPTDATYTYVNTAKPSYDESAISYDDADVFYDGFDSAAYTKIPKPTGTPYTKVPKPTT